MLAATISRATLSVTFSPESAAGPTPSPSPDGEQMSLFGPDRAHVSPSLSPVSEWERKTSATCGPISPASLKSAALQQSLENRLRPRMAAYGSPEYELTWKYWDMRSGPPICALRASGLRTSGNGFGGWGTPNTMDHLPSGNLEERKKKGGCSNLKDQVAGWATVRGTDAAGGSRPVNEKGQRVSLKTGQTFGINLADQSMLAGWATVTSQPANSTPENFLRRKRESVARGNSMGICISDLQMQAIAWTPGQAQLTSPASTEKRGALNPEFCRWLMGFPEGWGKSKPTATRLSRKSPPSS